MPTRPQPKKSAKPSPDPKNVNANKNTQTGTPRRHPWPEAFGGVISGPPGVGKTEFAAAFPSAKFYYDPQEPGVNDLIAYGRIPKPEFEPEEIDTFRKLVNTDDSAGKMAKQGVKTVVFDSLTGFEKLCFDYHCQQYFDGNYGTDGFLSYNKGPEQAARQDWTEFLQTCQNFIDEDINVLLLAHIQVKTFQNPEGPDYDRYSPFVNKHTWQYTHRWAKLSLFYNYSFSMAGKGGKDSEGNEIKQSVLKKGKVRDTSDVSRVIYTEWSPAWEAKNRLGLDPAFPAGDSGKEAFQNFLSAFKPGVIKK
jgi:hypothetical protein